MTGVDVLAVMGYLADRYVANRGTSNQFICCITPNAHGDDATLRRNVVGAAWLDLIEARAAVAELIEAVDDVYGTDSGESCQTPCPSCRIQAALARCTGDTK